MGNENKEQTKSQAEWVKWVIGIATPILLGIAGYSINLNLETEARVTALETKVTQAESELDNIWIKYNSKEDDALEWLERIIKLEAEITLLQYEIEELK